MKCSECHYENPANANYCVKCATPLPVSEDIVGPKTKTLEKPLKELTRGSTFAGRYEIIEELGEGGMGKVYRVFDKKIKEEVALKLLRPEIASDKKTIKRFSNELKLARKIAHRNVCKVYDLNEEKEAHFITMEYVPGENLKSMVGMMGQLSAGQVVFIIKQVCEGIIEAHRLGVVHRDLKSSNIMIDKEGNARVMDFGIARSLKAEGITGAGAMIGTPQYMSPEQAETKEADQRSDIYSLGVIMYEMMTGRLPFEGDTPLSIALKHMTETPPDPRKFNAQIPEDLNRLILKCLEKDKERRYQTANELLSELSKIEKEIPITEKIRDGRKLKTEKIVGIKWKNIFLFGSAAIAVILLMVGAFYLFTGRQQALDSIAVLPFKNIDADPDLEYLSYGITENIINKLAQLPSLEKVIARSSVFRYEGKAIDPQVVGQELGVDVVLVGQMIRRGDELSINVELVNTVDNRRMWGNRYRREISEIFTIQEEISDSIIENLRLRLSGDEIERLTKRYTESTEAFVAFSKGRFFWNKRTEDDLKKAVEYFEEAIRLDPNYALAYSGLANSYLLLPEYGTFLPKEAYPKVKEAALKALEIDNMLAEAHVSLAQVKRRYDYDWAAAEREYRRAIELDPNYATAHHWYGYDLMSIGLFDEALKEIKRAHELDPLSLVINRNLGQVLYRARRYDEAIETLQKTLEMDPNFSFVHFYLGSIYLRNSRYEEALAEFQEEKEIAKGWAVRVEAWIGVAYLKMGQREKAMEVLDGLLEKSKQEYVPQTPVAILYFVLGEDDKGFEWLEKAYEEYDSRLRILKADPIFDRVRADPRFIALVKKTGLG